MPSAGRRCCGGCCRGGRRRTCSSKPEGDGLTLLIARRTPPPAGASGAASSRAARRGSRARCCSSRAAPRCGWPATTAPGSALLQFVPTLALLLALAAAGDAAVASYEGGERPAAVAVALLDDLEPEHLSPGLVLHGDLRRERPDVLLVLRPGGGCATAHPQLRAAAVAAGGAPRRARRGRVPTLWIGADDPGALDFARVCVEELDAQLP